MTKARFEYDGGSRTVDDIHKQQRLGGVNDYFLASDVKRYKPREGENCVRILPPRWKDKETWGNYWSITTYVHYNVGPDGAAYMCLDKMKGKRCPVCEA